VKALHGCCKLVYLEICLKGFSINLDNFTFYSDWSFCFLFAVFPGLRIYMPPSKQIYKSGMLKIKPEKGGRFEARGIFIHDPCFDLDHAQLFYELPIIGKRNRFFGYDADRGRNFLVGTDILKL
jgi:hypothetical protein